MIDELMTSHLWPADGAGLMTNAWSWEPQHQQIGTCRRSIGYFVQRQRSFPVNADVDCCTASSPLAHQRISNFWRTLFSN